MITAHELMIKAKRALASSKLLLAEKDADGACNRAYYAMFDASRAALIAAGFAEIAITTKKHSGLISTFSLHLIKTGKLPVELGRSLNKVEDIRLMADYLGKEVDIDKADWSLLQAELFGVQLTKNSFLVKEKKVNNHGAFHGQRKTVFNP